MVYNTISNPKSSSVFANDHTEQILNDDCRTKLKQTGVHSEYLKRCCVRLAEENRQLQKEAQELRAPKLSSDFYNHMMKPSTTLIMCTSCERISVSSASSTSSAASVFRQPASITVKASSPVRLRELV
ncbi:hypothetical protein Ancab_037220 [Ancistrocladus abbreviatus]